MFCSISVVFYKLVWFIFFTYLFFLMKLPMGHQGSEGRGFTRCNPLLQPLHNFNCLLIYVYLELALFICIYLQFWEIALSQSKTQWKCLLDSRFTFWICSSLSTYVSPTGPTHNFSSTHTDLTFWLCRRLGGGLNDISCYWVWAMCYKHKTLIEFDFFFICSLSLFHVMCLHLMTNMLHHNADVVKLLCHLLNQTQSSNVFGLLFLRPLDYPW